MSQRNLNKSSTRQATLSPSTTAPDRSTEDVVSTEEFCFGLVDEIVENILDDQSEKYHEEEVIPWTIEYMGELLKETLDFAVRRD